MKVCDIIANQLGQVCLNMLGASLFVDLEDGLQFCIKGCKDINMVQIILDPCDTYTVKFWKISIVKKTFHGDLVFRQTECQLVKSHSDIYCDMLHDIIEEMTGLYTQL